jgi:hypothetical protein
MFTMRWRFILLLLLLASAASGQEKVYVSGFVNDLSTLQPLSSVNISTKHHVVASSDGNGFFALSANRGDTLAFTRLGYQPVIYVATVNNWDERIFMTEMARVLDEVIIRDSYTIHSSEEMQKSLKEDAKHASSPLNNFTMDPANQNRMIQTFGPSATITAPWDKWTKDAKEAKHLDAIITEQERTAVYQQFIHSMVVEQYMIDAFKLDHDTYLTLKEGFIVSNPDARYLKSRQDIIDLMVSYFASKR